MSVTTKPDQVEQLEQRIEEIETRLEEKDKRIEEIETRLEEKDKRIEELETRLEEKDEQISEQAQQITELEAEAKEYREQNGKDKAKLRKRVTGLEQNQQEQDNDQETQNTGSEDQDRDRTPLDQVVALPVDVAQQELTENQDRARFIATDILDYATKVPAGYMVTSSDIKTILAAKEDGTPHTQTVSRVMNFLDRFGQEDTKIVKKRGTRRIVFTKEAATRYHHTNTHNQITPVVMEGTPG